MLLALDAWLSSLIPDRGIIYWLFFANYLLALGFAVSEIYRSRTSQGSIAWILSLLILPFPMTLVYATFGLKLFDDYAAIQTHSGRVLRKVRAAKTKILDHPATEEWPVLANVSQLPFLNGNEVGQGLADDPVSRPIEPCRQIVHGGGYILRHMGRNHAGGHREPPIKVHHSYSQ